MDCLCLTRSTFAVSSGLLVLGVATQLGNLRSCQCAGPVELIAFCLSCNTTGTSTASSKDCAGWMNGDLVCETHCRNHLLDAEVLPRQRTDMNGFPTSKTRLLLPAAAVVENDASTSGGSCRNNFVEASGAASGFWGPLSVLLQGRLLDVISEAVAQTADLSMRRGS